MHCCKQKDGTGDRKVRTPYRDDRCKTCTDHSYIWCDNGVIISCFERYHTAVYETISTIYHWSTLIWWRRCQLSQFGYICASNKHLATVQLSVSRLSPPVLWLLFNNLTSQGFRMIAAKETAESGVILYDQSSRSVVACRVIVHSHPTAWCIPGNFTR